MREPVISIIVPAYNVENTVRKCIDSLLRINYPNYEILIVDDGSTDKTRAILFEYKNRIKIIESQHVGPSKCRNIAVKQAKSDYIALTDSDCIVDKNWLKELIGGFSNDKVVGVGGTQLSPEDETIFGKNVQSFFELTGFLGGYIKYYEHQASSIEDRDLNLKQVSHNPSCNVMYRKHAFLEIGGFDEKLWPGEDVDLDYRLKRKGYEFRYNPKAIAYHYRSQSIKELSNMMYCYGVMQGILTKRYGFFRKIQFVPVLVLFSFFLILINKTFLWFILLFILYILLRTKHLGKTISVVGLCVISSIVWNLGFIKGVMKKCGRGYS